MKEIEQAKQVIHDYGLKEKSRERSKVYKRAYVSAYLRSYGVSLQDIGEMLNRHHSSIMYLLDQHEQFKGDKYYLDAIFPIDGIIVVNESFDYKLMSNRHKVAVFKNDFEFLHEMKLPRETYAHTFKRILEHYKNTKE